MLLFPLPMPPLLFCQVPGKLPLDIRSNDGPDFGVGEQRRFATSVPGKLQRSRVGALPAS